MPRSVCVPEVMGRVLFGCALNAATSPGPLDRIQGKAAETVDRCPVANLAQAWRS